LNEQEPVLAEGDLDADPIRQFLRWFDDAVAAGIPEPHAMTLATVTADGAPSARMVLMKGVDARGFTFFTNYRSQKGRELAENPRAALVFRWLPLQRQVRVIGTVTKTSRAESVEYFATRPLDSQLGAWASAQSEPVASRAVLEQQLAEAAARFEGGEVPLPPWWGGYRVRPLAIELWQARIGRLHDRVRYERVGRRWRMERLQP
jgi:pyridoxamine 5'-phosphate oxidase